MVADVADKGMAAALYMVLSRTLIRTYSIQHPRNPERVLAAVNRRLLSDIKTGHFVTVFYAILDPAKGVLKYCNAGHNPPFYFKGVKEPEIQVLSRTGMALGVLEEETWKQEQIRIDQDDMLVVYSDGVIDALDANEVPYGTETLLSALKANLGRPAQEVQDDLLSRLAEFVGDAQPFDDITLITITRDTSS